MVVTDEQRRRMAPTGRLQVAVCVGPALSATWCVADAGGAPRGIAVDLGIELARRAGVPADIVSFPSSGAVVEAVGGGRWDLTFIPVDAERKKHVDFGPNYFLSESTYLVDSRVGIVRIVDVDRPEHTIVGIENTATLRSVRRTNQNAQAVGVASFDAAVAMFESRAADAVALSRETLNNLLPQIKRPAVILPGNFHEAGNAPGVPPGRGDAIVVLGNLLEAVKADGTMARIFATSGLAHLEVAPAGSMP